MLAPIEFLTIAKLGTGVVVKEFYYAKEKKLYVNQVQMRRWEDYLLGGKDHIFKSSYGNINVCTESELLKVKVTQGRTLT